MKKRNPFAKIKNTELVVVHAPDNTKGSYLK